ncbi:MAG: hypothetical protein NTX25_03020, partial [Proteobacteria bacterium]|nr:hypothetical protein [Pseudomonadota bacterium]
MRYFFIVAGLGFLCLPCQVLAQDWSFSPEIYARGGVTYKSDFSKEAGFGDGREKAFNLGPYNEESLIASPLTEVTVHANYGDSFRFHYGVNVSGNRQFQYSDEKSPTSRSFVAERLAYGEFRASQGMSFWSGHRPF